MDYLPIVFAITLIIIAVVLTVVGVNLVMVLMELKRTLRKVNDTLETVDASIESVISPLHNLGGMASGLTTGFKVFEAFAGWLQRSRIESDSNSNVR